MTGLIMAAQLLLGLSILVVLHEFGHYLFARMFKIRVEQFYLFFNPKIALFRAKRVNGKWQFRLFAKNVPSRFRKKTNDQGNEIKDEKGNYIFEPIPLEELSDNDWRKYPETTEWGIGWLPFGGYCNIAGMIDENKRANQLSSEPQPWELRSKPAWQRLFVMIGGIIMNLVLGCALFVFFTYHYVGGYIANDDVSKDGIYVYEAGRNLGFETGDKIVTVNGNKIVRFGDAQKTKVLFGSEITVERNGQFIDITLPDTTYRIMQHSGNLFAGNNFPAVVDSVTPNSVAMRSGLQHDDHIIFINDKEIKPKPAVNNSFYDEYNPQIRAIVSRILTNANQTGDIDDCVHAVFLELMEKLQQFNETRGSMGAFISVITRSVALNYCKSNSRKTNELVGDEKLDFLSSPINYHDEFEFDSLVENIVSRLNKEDRLLFTMRYLYHYTPVEIAKALHINRSAVDMRTTRLKNKIKKFLTKGGIII